MNLSTLSIIITITDSKVTKNFSFIALHTNLTVPKNDIIFVINYSLLILLHQIKNLSVGH